MSQKLSLYIEWNNKSNPITIQVVQVKHYDRICNIEVVHTWNRDCTKNADKFDFNEVAEISLHSTK